MMNFENAQICTGEVKRETAKDLLGNMDTILKELKDEVRMISDAVYRGDSCKAVEEAPNEPKMLPMVAIMREQRDTAEYLLKEIVKIREALW